MPYQHYTWTQVWNPLEARRAGCLRSIIQGTQRVLAVAQRSPAVTIWDLRGATIQAFETGNELRAAVAALSVLAATAMLRIHEYIVYEGASLRPRGLEQLVLSDLEGDRVATRGDARVWRARQALRMCDIDISGNTPGMLVVRLRAWKFGLPGAEHTIPIRCSADWAVCAHCCVSKFLSIRRAARMVSQAVTTISWLAQLSDGSFITEDQVTQHIRNSARLAGLQNWTTCTPHSLRRGGATQLLAASGDKTMVREVGRWRSEKGINPYLVTHVHRYHEAWERARDDVRTQGGTLGTAARPIYTLAPGGGSIPLSQGALGVRLGTALPSATPTQPPGHAAWTTTPPFGRRVALSLHVTPPRGPAQPQFPPPRWPHHPPSSAPPPTPGRSPAPRGGK